MEDAERSVNLNTNVGTHRGLKRKNTAPTLSTVDRENQLVLMREENRKTRDQFAVLQREIKKIQERLEQQTRDIRAVEGGLIANDKEGYQTVKSGKKGYQNRPGTSQGQLERGQKREKAGK